MQPPAFLILVAFAASTTVISYLVGHVLFSWLDASGPEGLAESNPYGLRREQPVPSPRPVRPQAPAYHPAIRRSVAARFGGFQELALPLRCGAGRYQVMDCRLYLN